MLDIQALTSDIDRLQHSADWWANTAVYLTALTAILGALYFVASRMAIRKSTQLREAQFLLSRAKDVQLIRDLKGKDVEIEKAKQFAADANKRAKSIEHDNLTLRGHIATLERDAAYAKKDLATLQKETAVARSKQAKAEKELIELRERIRPRTINEYQREMMVAALVGVPNKGHVTIHCVLGDAEGLAFAAQIKAVFEAAQWESIDGVDQASFSTNPVGIFIIVREEKTTPLYVFAIRVAFHSVGIGTVPQENPNLPEGSAEILVGNKP